MASPPNIFKQSKNPLLNATNTATVGDIWVDLNDAPATLKTLVTATGAVAHWVLKKSEILGSEISLSGQTPKSIESDDSILFKIGGANRFKISSGTIPGGAPRIGELTPDGADTATSQITWKELSASNPLGDLNLSPVLYDPYSRMHITNFSDESGGGFVFKLADEQLLSMRPFRAPNISTEQPPPSAPLSGQVVIGEAVPKYPVSSTLRNGEKLVINGNLRIGNSTVSNFISFGGTWGDGRSRPSTGQDGGGHTYVGERVYGVTTGAQVSELILFKGNDSFSGIDVDRIRHIAGGHVFQTWESGELVSGTFDQIATTSSLKDRLVINPGGEVSISKSLNVATTCTVNTLQVSGNSTFYGNNTVYGNWILDTPWQFTVLGAARFDNATVKMTALPVVSSAANLYIGGDGRIYKSGVNLDDAANAAGTVKAYGYVTRIYPYPYTPTLVYGSGISSVTVVNNITFPDGYTYGTAYRVTFTSAQPNANYVVLFPDVAGMNEYTGSNWQPAKIFKSSSYFDFVFPTGYFGSPSGAYSTTFFPFEFAVIR